MKFFSRKKQQAGKPISARTINQALQMGYHGGGLRVAPPLHMQTVPGGSVISLQQPPVEMFAQTGAGGIPARSGTTLGSASVTLYWFNGSDLSSSGLTETAYNYSSTAIPASKYCIVRRLMVKWIVTSVEC